MARKRITEPMLKNWEEVDECLKQISDAENEVTKIEATMNQDIAKIKAAASEQSEMHKEAIKVNGSKIKEYVTAHRDELKGKSRALTFGTVGFRMSTKLLLPKTIKDVIQKLRERGMMDCVVVSENVDKDAIKKYPETKIQAVGGYLQQSDTFWYETNKNLLGE